MLARWPTDSGGARGRDGERNDRVTILPDAATILAKLPDWIEDYCEVHPHSGLKFRSPREFMRLSA